jgi:hypothetical protein
MPSFNNKIRQTLFVALLIFSTVLSNFEGFVFGQCNVTISATSPLCNGQSTGVLQATVNNFCGCPNSVYFRLINPLGQIVQTSPLVNGLSYTFSNLPALPNGQSYSVEVSQNLNFGPNDICASGGASLVDNSQINVSATINGSILCHGQSTGSITVTPSGGFIGISRYNLYCDYAI